MANKTPGCGKHLQACSDGGGYDLDNCHQANPWRAHCKIICLSFPCYHFYSLIYSLGFRRKGSQLRYQADTSVQRRMEPDHCVRHEFGDCFFGSFRLGARSQLFACSASNLTFPICRYQIRTRELLVHWSCLLSLNPAIRITENNSQSPTSAHVVICPNGTNGTT